MIISSKLKVTNESSVVYTTVNVYIEEILEEAIKHHDDAKRKICLKKKKKQAALLSVCMCFRSIFLKHFFLCNENSKFKSAK